MPVLIPVVNYVHHMAFPAVPDLQTNIPVGLAGFKV
jgi:hypothetical protein